MPVIGDFRLAAEAGNFARLDRNGNVQPGKYTSIIGKIWSAIKLNLFRAAREKNLAAVTSFKQALADTFGANLGDMNLRGISETGTDRLTAKRINEAEKFAVGNGNKVLLSDVRNGPLAKEFRDFCEVYSLADNLDFLEAVEKFQDKPDRGNFYSLRQDFFGDMILSQSQLNISPKARDSIVDTGSKEMTPEQMKAVLMPAYDEVESYLQLDARESFQGYIRSRV